MMTKPSAADQQQGYGRPGEGREPDRFARGAPGRARLGRDINADIARAPLPEQRQGALAVLRAGQAQHLRAALFGNSMADVVAPQQGAERP